MKRDFRSELSQYRCYDRGVEETFRENGVPAIDCILQNREELVEFCYWIENQHIKSYLEIGIWTGRLITTLHHLFQFATVAGCDLLEAQEKWRLNISVPEKTKLFVGDSNSDDYVEWRRGLGPIDLVFIDSDHDLLALRRCFEINSQLPHRFLAFHDIHGDNKWTSGVREFWEELTWGNKLEIVSQQVESDLPLSKMGIGIWSSGESLRWSDSGNTSKLPS